MKDYEKHNYSPGISDHCISIRSAGRSQGPGAWFRIQQWTSCLANVKVKGLDLGAVSDENGYYSLALTPGSYTLEVEFIGYESQVISEVIVEAADLELDPVVLGARRMKKDINVALSEDQVEPSNE